jgi:two-component system C4-dicarboxylate transport sensor histidine kinase DctB
MVVHCHRGRIKQVFLNLIRNAVDAMKWTEQKKLEIFVIDNDDEVEIRVVDSGIGIADHVSRELFTPFVTTKDVGDGLGLGLSICNRIVDNIGGSIRGENRVGGGAQFIVVLPIVKNSTENADG